MRETGQKKLGLFSPITSREDALEITKGAAQAFYGLAVLQTVLGFFIQKAMIADGILYAILAAFLHLLASRVAAVLLLLASAAGLLITATNMLGVSKQGGNNVILAVIMVVVSVRAVEATFKLRSYPEESGAPRTVRTSPSAPVDRVATDAVRHAPPATTGDAERRRIELTREAAAESRIKGFGVKPPVREPDLATRLRFSAAQCSFDASGLRARTSDGKPLVLPWSDLSEVRARILPPDRPWDSALIVDFVPASRDGQPAAPIRLLPLTGMTFRTLPGTPASSRRENVRRLVLFALSQNPAAIVEPESVPFVREGKDCPRFLSMVQFGEYDARYG
jgi:hypothetical protein